MAQGLHLAPRLALQQVLAPQLQQSLALLQAPVLELRALVASELAQNPVLEELSDGEGGPKTNEEGEASLQSSTRLNPRRRRQVRPRHRETVATAGG
jgi:DNA-directed RNA polymerase specialized sigma54-like protein